MLSVDAIGIVLQYSLLKKDVVLKLFLLSKYTKNYFNHELKLFLKEIRLQYYNMSGIITEYTEFTNFDNAHTIKLSDPERYWCEYELEFGGIDDFVARYKKLKYIDIEYDKKNRYRWRQIASCENGKCKYFISSAELLCTCQVIINEKEFLEEFLKDLYKFKDMKIRRIDINNEIVIESENWIDLCNEKTRSKIIENIKNNFHKYVNTGFIHCCSISSKFKS